MRRLTLATAGAIFIVLPQTAMAVVYDFHSTELTTLSPLPLVFDFALDTATATVSGRNTNFGDVSISRNGVPFADNTVAASFGTEIGSPLFFLVDTDSKPFYSGTGSDIRFDPGSFVIADGFTNGIGTLAITEVPVGAVPEPSTWLSLIVGLGIIGTAFRLSRRRRARATPV